MIHIREVPVTYKEWTSGYYLHVYRCKNCLRDNKRMIKKGILIKGTKILCSNCGCQIKGCRNRYE